MKSKFKTASLVTAVAGLACAAAMHANAADVTLGWDAATYDNDGTWEVNQFDSSFANASTARWQGGTTQTLVNAGTNLANINSYIQTPDYNLVGTGGDSWHDILGDAASKLDATWEFVFSPGTFTGTRSVFDTGGSGSGVNLRMIGSDLNFRFQSSNTAFLELNTDLSAIGGAGDFYHIVAVADNQNASSISALYINGQLVDGPGANTSTIVDWDGSDGAGLGKTNGTTPQGASFTDPFAGDVAVLRQYSGQLLSQAQIKNNYNQVAGGPVVTVGWDAATYDNDGSWEVDVHDLNVAGSEDVIWTNGSGTLTTGATTNFDSIDSFISSPSFQQRQNPTPGAANDSFQEVFGDTFTKQDASWEVVFRPGDYTGKHIIFEVGGNGAGTILELENGILEFIAQGDPNNVMKLSADLSAIGDADEFFHIVGVSDIDGTNALSALFVNGVLVDGLGDSVVLTDWSGTDPGAIGADVGSSTAGGNVEGNASDYTAFSGDLALIRLYGDQALGQAEVDALYAAVPEPSSLVLLGLGGLAMMRRRR